MTLQAVLWLHTVLTYKLMHTFTCMCTCTHRHPDTHAHLYVRISSGHSSLLLLKVLMSRGIQNPALCRPPFLHTATWLSFCVVRFVWNTNLLLICPILFFILSVCMSV